MQRCEYCKRFFKNKHGLAIHLAFCRIKKFKDVTDKTRKGVVSIHTLTPYPDIDNRIREFNP